VLLDSSPVFANQNDVGVYATAGNSEIRWIESDISALSPTLEYAVDMLAPRPFDVLVESVDLSNGGEVPRIGGTSVHAANTVSLGGVSTQLDKIFEDNDIRFNGLRCEIIRFEIRAGVLVNPDGEIVFRGICGDPTWTESRFRLPVDNARLKRRANLGTIITEENYPQAKGESLGQIVPVTIGRFIPEFDDSGNDLWNGYAKFLRTANKREYFFWNWDVTTFDVSPTVKAKIWDSNTSGRDRWYLAEPGSKITDLDVKPIDTVINVADASAFTQDDLVRVRNSTYNETTPKARLAADAASGQADLVVDESSKFDVGAVIRIEDHPGGTTPNFEYGTIQSISSNTITLTGNLANSYTVLNNGSVYQSAGVQSETLVVESVDLDANTVTLVSGVDTYTYLAPISLVVDGTSNGATKAFAMTLTTDDVPIDWYVNDVLTVAGTIDLTSHFSNDCMEVIDGAGAGQCRRVESARVDLDYNPRLIIFIMDEVYENKPRGGYEGLYLEGTDINSWVRIVRIYYEYNVDVWTCHSFNGTDGVAITAEPYEVFAYAEPGTAQVGDADTDAPVVEQPIAFYQLPGNAVQNGNGTAWNQLDIDSDQLDPLSDNIAAFLILPMYSVFPMQQDLIRVNFGQWAKILDRDYARVWPGVYEYKAGNSLSAFNTVNARELLTTDAAAGQAHIIVARGGAFTQWDTVFIEDDSSGNNESAIVLGVSGNDITLTANLTNTYEVSENAQVYTTTIVDYSRCNDKNAHTYIETNINGGVSAYGGVALTGYMPTFPRRFLFDSLYIGVHSYIEPFAGTINGAKMYVAVKGWGGIRKMVTDGKDTGDDDARYQNLPDWYYQTNVPDDASKWFWSEIDDTVGSEEVLSGYVSYPIPLNTQTEAAFKRIQEFLLFCELHASGQGSGLRYRLYEVAAIFKKTLSIADALYAPVYGREFQSSWDGRKTDSAPILNPIDAIEHILRLQNWSELTAASFDWGKQYSIAAIDTGSSEGGFDYEGLAGSKEYEIAWQLHNYADTWSDSMVRDLCRQFFLCQFQDPITAEERITFFADKAYTTPTTTITLDDIIGPIRDVQGPQMKGIYPEPVMRYGFNHGSNDFDKVIRITRTSEDVYDSSYVIGLSGTTAELMWTRGHVLWNAFRQIEEAPDTLVDCPAIARDEDAIQRLDTWFTWMGAVNTDGTPAGVVFSPKKRIGFSVPYDLGKDWFLTQHHNLQLPHQTDDVVTEFAIERLEKNLTAGDELVTVEVILYGDAAVVSTYVQDTMTAGVDLDDWQDNMDVQAVTGGGPDTQDIT